jgi:hypothetical protein
VSHLNAPGCNFYELFLHLDLRAYKLMPEGNQKKGKGKFNNSFRDADYSSTECKAKLDAAQKAVKG